MNTQSTFVVSSRGRGFTNITTRVAEVVTNSAVKSGIANVFARHTSCSITITENADPDVRRDLETLARRWAPDGDKGYQHTLEGEDDMSAHGRNILVGTSLTVPVGGGKLLLGTWQGIFLWEHRTESQAREVVVTVLGS